MATVDRLRELKAGTVLPVWGVTALAAVIVGIASPPEQDFLWLLVTLAAAVVLTFAVQLATLTKDGFVDRVMASVAGAVLILGIATGVLALVHVLNG